MAKFSSVKNPVFLFADSDKILVQVNIEGVEGEHDFLATRDDIAKHGREFHAELLDGKYGPIAAYQPPPPPSDEVLAQQAVQKRNELLQASDWTQLPDIPQATKDKWAPYRQALRDVPTQGGFPKEIDWPLQPSA